MRASKKQAQRIARTSDIKMITFFKKRLTLFKYIKTNLKVTTGKRKIIKLYLEDYKKNQIEHVKSSYQYSQTERLKSQLDIGKEI